MFSFRKVQSPAVWRRNGGFGEAVMNMSIRLGGLPGEGPDERSD